jgi:3D (Asp-Asp-Asp) domain-containing protein
MTSRFNNSSASLLIASLFVSLVTACGGGKESANSNGTAALLQTTATSYTGPITGFGSVVINGMRFATVGSSIADDDGIALNSSNLRLGSIVHVEGMSDNVASGTAGTIVVTPALLGTVDSVDASNTFLMVMGRKVSVNASTNYYNAATGLYATLAAITTGSYVEVHGLVQADGSFLATLIERRTAQAAYRIRGQVSNLDTVNKTFSVGTLAVNYGTSAITGLLANSAWVKVQATTAPLLGVLTATAVLTQTAQAGGGASGLVAGVASSSVMKLKGVAAGAPIANNITLAGVNVSLANALYLGGTAAAIAAGTALEVKGTWNGSTLQATLVEFEGYRATNVNGGAAYELYGAVTAFTSNSNLVVQGVTVNASSVTGFPASIAVGTYLEIKGNMTAGVLTAMTAKYTAANTGVIVGGGHGDDGSGDDNHGGGTFQTNSYEINGVVSGYVSLSDFMVNGVRVNASAAFFEHGGTVSNARFVEAKGNTNASGIFIATKIEVK